ncbi:CehA/McbA family metallohydrolase [Mesorhizobium sp. M0435]|uniref:CehA/McbA family metallohydrolase n=1 Tax=Mesorhizobium sp. M0435 TaxID=2956944 RepID=UPI00333D01C1
MLEGAAEGVNVVNLLASQWGEMMSNVGDFDGRTTFGSKAAGGGGEFLVRVGTENRQRVLGHISLLGYSGNMIIPLAAGGPDESAIGDTVNVLNTEWAQQCKKRGGLVVLPHYPDPRMENAATIVLGEADALEMTSFSDFYTGIDAYSVSDWCRYLNNGYLIPAVAGTDKMSAEFAVGLTRTYAKIPDGREFSYETWMDAVRAGHTFVTYGPLMDLNVDGKPMGGRISLPSSGGTVNVSWNLASVIVPMTRIDLIVNGEVQESRTLKPWQDAGSWSIRVEKSSWIALLVRAKYDDKPEMIAAHSSAVMVDVEGSQLFAAADALTILKQIEGSMAYIDTIGTRAEATRYKEMRLMLQSAYRRLHNRMHQMGHDHPYSVGTHHPEHD